VSEQELVGCRLPVAGCQLPVASCQLPVSSFQFPVTGNGERGTGNGQRATGSRLQVLDESLEGVVEGAGERLDDRGDFALRRLVDRGSGGDRIGDREPQCGRRQNDDEHTDHSDEAEAEPGGVHRRTGSVYNRARSSATLTSGRPEVFRPTPQLTCRTTFPNWPLF